MREASKHERSMLVKSSLHSLLQLRDHLTSQLSGLKVADKPANASGDPAVRASCAEFVLAGLWATDRVSRTVRHGRTSYEVK